MDVFPFPSSLRIVVWHPSSVICPLLFFLSASLSPIPRFQFLDFGLCLILILVIYLRVLYALIDGASCSPSIIVGIFICIYPVIRNRHLGKI